MKKTAFIVSLFLVSLFLFSPVLTEGAFLSEDIFPNTLGGLPLSSLEKETPDEEIAEGFSARYGTEEPTKEIGVLLWRARNEEIVKNAEEELIQELKSQFSQIFNYIEWGEYQKVSIGSYQATLINYRAYFWENNFFDGGIIFLVVRDYLVLVQIVNYEGELSLSELKDTLGFFVNKVPGEEPSNFFPDLEVSLSSKNINLELGGSTTVELAIKNIGQGNAEGVNFTINVDKPEVIDVYPSNQNIGTIEPGKEFVDYIGIVAQKSGTAYLAIHVKGTNASSTMKFVQVTVPEALAIDVPESIFLNPGQTQEISVFLTNAGRDPIYVQTILLQSENSSVVSIEEGFQMEVRGQGAGIRQDEVFSTESDDITKCISPKPKIKAESVGQTELVFKVSLKDKTLEKKVRIGVGQAIGGKNPKIDMEITPSALVLERDEARKVEVILVNTGSEIIKEGKIYISSSQEAPFSATREISFGFIRPGKEAKAEIEVIGNSQFPSGLGGKDTAVTGNLIFDGQFTTLDGRNFDFEKEMKVSLVGERERCGPEDSQCAETVDCLISLSNEMGCALELADVVPYLDKPVAVVLLTSDVCEIKERAESGDDIGAAISTLLMASDLGDNAPDAVPVAGNIFSVLCDVIEGSADCIEGFVYDAVNKYCAGGQGGYSACASNLFGLIAQESNKWQDPKAAKNSVVAIGGSPVTLTVVDDKGKELGLRDGVLNIEKEDLKLVFIRNPDQLTSGYNFKIQGIGQGSYNLDIGLISGGKVVETAELRDQPINLDQEVSIPLAVKAKKGELTDLFVGEEARQFKEKTETKKLFIYLLIGGISLIVLAAIVILVIVIIKKKKK